MKEKQEPQNISQQIDLLDFSKDQPPSLNIEETSKLMNTTSQSEVDRHIESTIKAPDMLLILDTETTGLDPSKHSCLEIGVILFNVCRREVLAQQSFLLPVETNDAEFINRIPAEITRLDQPWREGLEYFELLLNCAEAVVAHNAAFDRQWFGITPLPNVSKPWICTMEDISWPKEIGLSNRPSVRDLALAYGVPVWNAHRALTDCIYISEVFRRCSDLEDLLLKGLEPRRLMRAEVSYDQRHLAKEAGFRWNDPVRGAWTRRLTDNEVLDLDFSVVCLENEP